MTILKIKLIWATGVKFRNEERGKVGSKHPAKVNKK